LLFVLLLAGCARQPTDVKVDTMALNCTALLSARSDGEIGLAFELRNPGVQPVKLTYFQPYIQFDLVAEAADGQVPIVQPAYDTGVRPVNLTLDGGQTARIETPIYLRFDPNVAPSGGDQPKRWSLRHAPAQLTLRFTLRLNGAEVAPCEVRLNPSQLK
jgi:hypothetical protein